MGPKAMAEGPRQECTAEGGHGWATGSVLGAANSQSRGQTEQRRVTAQGKQATMPTSEGPTSCLTLTLTLTLTLALTLALTLTLTLTP